MGTAIDGIVSGLDTTAIVNSLIAVEAAPMRQMQGDLARAELKKAKVAEFKTKLTAISDALNAINEEDEFGEYNATLGEDGYFTATADSEAIPGTYAIQVNALAKSEVSVTQGYAESDAALSLSGTLAVAYDGESTVISVDSSTTLEQIAADLDDIDGIQAYIMNTGDSKAPYRLVVMGESTGSDYDITLTNKLSGSLAPTFTEQVTAQDSEAEINGITVYSSSNTLDDVLPGIDLDLTQVSDDAIDLTVNRDDDAIADKVSAFVDAYNAMDTYYGVQTNFDGDAGVKGTFFGDSALRSIVDKLSNIVTSDTDLSGDYGTFNEIGIEYSQTGQISLDSSKFTDALGDNYDDVMAVFTDEDGPAAALLESLDDYYLASDGLIATKTDTIEDNIEDLEDAISNFELRLVSYEERLRRQFTTMEMALGQFQATQGYLSALLTTSSE